MPKQKAEYELLLEKATEALKHSPEKLKEFLEVTEKYGEAASDMTKDELALIKAYLKSDMKEFADNVEKSSEPFAESPFYKLVSESIWQGLADITDKTQVEWHEVTADLEHHGVYKAGELIGLGELVCQKCGHKQAITHVTRIEPCIKCGGIEFTRKPLAP
ncbi:zinc ribbon-containing protein [Photobacterium damselae]|uniref:Zinc ribbon-containing protein n=1 Tax=Photobacterium damselae subsp. damselae TaxID=85581 RepID=A0AAD3ZV78_PHODD|nr:zinc ribbon-containing protein [Photobacterium damselae]KAB1179745.1 zinc ribbon-containing protein [Photobacterium damselae subsp. damselae]